ncbi:MAG: hypothetical protein DIJKHBIC_00551 [Thermoanaerobaculia bacterium]|nr:hypothetical protein [Thermoanaerobaculia bacterium]
MPPRPPPPVPVRLPDNNHPHRPQKIRPRRLVGRVPVFLLRHGTPLVDPLGNHRPVALRPLLHGRGNLDELRPPDLLAHRLVRFRLGRRRRKRRKRHDELLGIQTGRIIPHARVSRGRPVLVVHRPPRRNRHPPQRPLPAHPLVVCERPVLVRDAHRSQHRQHRIGRSHYGTALYDSPLEHSHDRSRRGLAEARGQSPAPHLREAHARKNWPDLARRPVPRPPRERDLPIPCQHDFLDPPVPARHVLDRQHVLVPVPVRHRRQTPPGEHPSLARIHVPEVVLVARRWWCLRRRVVPLGPVWCPHHVPVGELDQSDVAPVACFHGYPEVLPSSVRCLEPPVRQALTRRNPLLHVPPSDAPPHAQRRVPNHVRPPRPLVPASQLRWPALRPHHVPELRRVVRRQLEREPRRHRVLRPDRYRQLKVSREQVHPVESRHVEHLVVLLRRKRLGRLVDRLGGVTGTSDCPGSDQGHGQAPRARQCLPHEVSPRFVPPAATGYRRHPRARLKLPGIPPPRMRQKVDSA